MSRNLVINTQRKWTPSPELAIREEDSDEDTQPIHKQRLIEEVEEDDEQGQDDEDDEEEEEEEEEEEDGSDFTSSPSIPDENINFDLVYTLHTFEATVDGQASVKKGDALTLLDDSNSYWWLIRDLKTSEVGYIPAENIETPFERLARLNKHRNVELTSMDQATHYINNKAAPNASSKKKKKVVLSTSLNVQLHVLLTGEDDDEIEEETYEEWSEEMLDDDDMDEDIEQHTEKQQQQKQQANTEEDEDDDDDKPLQQSMHKNSQILDSKNNLHHDETKDALQNQHRIKEPTAVNNHADPVRHPSREQVPVNSKVLRVFAGNVDVGASYHSVRVTESTSVDELLMSAMEKFHISQIETKNGRSHGKNSGVEYYLTVKSRDGDEITLDPEDKPYAIHESLTAHLTTPMPSLTQFRQLVPTSDYVNRRKKKRSSSISSLSDSSLQFFMHKRIKRVNDKSGQVHIKVSLMTTAASTTAPAAPLVSDKMAAIKKMTTLRRFGKKKTKKDKAEMERIDKMIAIPANISISDLTSTALVKFHIISDMEQAHQYRLILNTNGKDTLLNLDQRLSDVLKGLEATAKEKRFILHNFSSNLDDQRPVSLSSSTSSSSSSSARPTSIMTRLDSNTEAILKRVDAALEAFEPTNNIIPRKDIANPNFPSPMSVSRNEGGVDIHLPHGVLRSTPLSEKQTQYSLMKNPNTLVLQRVLPADKITGRKVPEKNAISGEEMATLVKYGSQYLDAYDTANNTIAPTSAAASSRLFVERDSGKSLSSLEDLEKELHRIITSHSS
ncbi:protein phosphatase regulator [Mucor circinelloides]